MDDATQDQLQAAAFRQLVAHLRKRTDVQNIDLMILGGFCRNCLSNWYRDAAAERGIEIDRETARKMVYGMAYGDWKKKYQTEATAEQKARLAQVHSY